MCWSFFDTIFADFFYIKIPAGGIGGSHDLDKISSIEKPAIHLTKDSDSCEPSSAASQHQKNSESDEPSSAEAAEAASPKNHELGEPSSSTQASKKPESPKGVITGSDYEWEDDEEAYSESDFDPNESEVSKFINSSLFEVRLNKANKDELKEVLDVLEFSKKSYENSKVPVAKEEISQLTIKVDLCKKALENKVIEENKFLEGDNSKGKGKAKDN